jgi:hypothetical protein
MDTDQLTTDATIAAGVVGGGLFLAEKAGNSKAKRLRERFETKHDQFIQWQKKYPKLMWWFGELNAIVDAALGFGDLTTDILTAAMFLQKGHSWWFFWTVLFIVLPFLLSSYAIGQYIRRTYGPNGKFLWCLSWYRLLPCMPLLPPLFDLAMPVLRPMARFSNEFGVFLASYTAVSTFTQAFFESLPQTLLQGWIIYRCTTYDCNLGTESSFVVWRGWIVSLLNIGKQLIGNYFFAKTMGLGMMEYLRSLLELGQGLPLQALKKNELKVLSFPNRQHPLSNQELMILTKLLKKNTSVHTVDLNNLGLNEEGAVMVARVFGYKTKEELVKAEANVPVAASEEADTPKKKSVNSSVKVLNLNGNEIGTGGAIAISESLRINEVKLEELLIADNSTEITDYSGVTRKEARKESKRVKNTVVARVVKGVMCCCRGQKNKKTTKKGRDHAVKQAKKVKKKTRDISTKSGTKIVPRSNSTNSMNSEEELGAEDQVKHLERRKSAQMKLMKEKNSKQAKAAVERLERRKLERKTRAMKVLEESNKVRQVEAFKHLKKEAINVLLTRMKLLVYRDKKVICRAKAPASSFSIITQGEVNVFIPFGKNHSQVNTMSTLDSFGEISLVDDSATRSATCIAQGEVHVMSLTRKDYAELREMNVLDQTAENKLLQATKKYKVRDQQRRMKLKVTEMILMQPKLKEKYGRIWLAKKNNFGISKIKKENELRENVVYKYKIGDRVSATVPSFNGDFFDGNVTKLIGNRDDPAYEVTFDDKRLPVSRVETVEESNAHPVGVTKRIVERTLAEMEEKKAVHSLELQETIEEQHKELVGRVAARCENLKKKQEEMLKKYGKKLKQIPCFKKLSKENFQKVIGSFRAEEIKHNTKICEVDDIAYKFYVILEGSVDIYIPSKCHDRIRQMHAIDEVSNAEKPFFGESSLLPGNHLRTATCIASAKNPPYGTVKLLSLTRDRYETCIRKSSKEKNTASCVFRRQRNSIVTGVNSELLNTFNQYALSDMKKYSVCNDAAIHLGKTISAGHSALKVLEMQRNRIDEIGAMAIAQDILLMISTHPEYLKLEDINITGYKISIKDILKPGVSGKTLSFKPQKPKHNKGQDTKRKYPKQSFCRKLIQSFSKAKNKELIVDNDEVKELTVLDLKFILRLLLSEQALSKRRLIDFTETEEVVPADTIVEIDSSLGDKNDVESNRESNSETDEIKEDALQQTKPKLLASWLTQIGQQVLQHKLNVISKLTLRINKLDFQGCVILDDIVESVMYEVNPSVEDAPNNAYSGSTEGETVVVQLKDWYDMISVSNTIVSSVDDNTLVCSFSDLGVLHVKSTIGRDMRVLFEDDLKTLEICGINGQVDMFRDAFRKGSSICVNEVNFPFQEVDSGMDEKTKVEKLASAFSHRQANVRNMSTLVLNSYRLHPSELYAAVEIDEFRDKGLDRSDLAVVGTILQQNLELKTLDVSGNMQLDDFSAQYFVPLVNTLKVLNLSGTGIGEITIDLLSKALISPSTSLVELSMTDLDSVHITSNCANLFVDMLKSNRTLEKLELDWNIFPLEEFCKLFETCHRSLPREFFYSKDNLRFVQEDATRLAKAVVSFKYLEKLVLDKFEIRPQVLQKQEHMDFSKQFLTDPDFIIVASILIDRGSRLKTLNLSDNPDLGLYAADTIFALINKSSNLKSINLSNSDVRNVTIEKIGNWMGTSILEVLNISGCKAVKDAGATAVLEGLKQSSSMKSLAMDWDRISLSLVGQFIATNSVAIPSAMELNVGSVEEAEFLGDALAANDNMTSVSFTNSNFNIVLKDLREIKSLQLSEGKITDMDIITVCKILGAKNTSLESIDVSENPNLSENAGCAIASLLGQQAATSSSLKSVNCDGTSIGNASVKLLVETIMQYVPANGLKLKSLKLRGTNITSEGAKYFTPWLKSDNCTLGKEQLSLDWEKFDSETIKALVLTNHRCLPVDIRLQIASIEDAEEITTALETNDHIETLTIKNYRLPLKKLKNGTDLNFAPKQRDEATTLSYFDYILILILIEKNNNLKKLNLSRTFETLQDSEQRVTVVKRLAALLKSKAKLSHNFDVSLRWEMLQCDDVLILMKSGHHGLPKSLDLSLSNPTADDVDGLAKFIKKKSVRLEFIRLHEVFISLNSLNGTTIQMDTVCHLAVPKNRRERGSGKLVKKLTPADLKIVQNKIESNSDLERFVFSSREKNSHMDDLTLKPLMRTLVNKRKLRWLSLTNCHVGDMSCKVLEEVIKTCRKLSNIGLERNDITEEGAAYLVQGVFERAKLSNNSPEVILTLSRNKIGKGFSKLLREIMLDKSNRKRARKLKLNIKSQETDKKSRISLAQSLTKAREKDPAVIHKHIMW